MNWILKVFNPRYPTLPFSPPSKATPPKQVNSSLALAMGLPSLLGDWSCAMNAGVHFAQIGRHRMKLLDWFITGLVQIVEFQHLTYSLYYNI